MQDINKHGNLQRATIHHDEAVCPVCWKKLCRVKTGSMARGIELWCKVCRLPVMLEIE